MSATLTPEVQSLKKLVLHNAAVLKLEETEDEAARLAQYYMLCTEKDKFLVLYGANFITAP
jgi:ATP-dependent RNA helicase DDX56/DBP9